MKVPDNSSRPMHVPVPRQTVPAAFIAMAAAHMNSIGRLGTPPPQLDLSKLSQNVNPIGTADASK